MSEWINIISVRTWSTVHDFTLNVFWMYHCMAVQIFAKIFYTRVLHFIHKYTHHILFYSIQLKMNDIWISLWSYDSVEQQRKNKLKSLFQNVAFSVNFIWLLLYYCHTVSSRCTCSPSLWSIPYGEHWIYHLHHS